MIGCDTTGRKPGVVFVFARGTASAILGGGAAQERWWQTQALRIDDGGGSISDGYAAVAASNNYGARGSPQHPISNMVMRRIRLRLENCGYVRSSLPFEAMGMLPESPRGCTA